MTWNTGTGQHFIASNPVLQPAGIFDVKNTYGAVGNGKHCSDAVMNGTTGVLTSDSKPFALTDVGKTIYVPGAGASGATLVTPILSFQNTGQVTLTAASQTAITAGNAVWGGTDDTAALLAGWTAAAAANGTAWHPPGVYLFSSLALSNINKLTLDGPGAILCCTYTNDNVTNAIVLQGNDLTFRNLTVLTRNPLTPTQRSQFNAGDLLRIGGPIGTWKSRVTVDHCHFSGAFGGNVDAYFANTVEIINNFLENPDGNNINVTDCQKDVVIRGNICYNSGDDSIACVSDSNVPNGTLRLIITDNIVFGADAKGIGTTGGDYVLIANNHVSFTYQFCIAVFQDSFYGLSPTNHAVVVNNTLKDAGQRYGAGYLHGAASTTGNAVEIGASNRSNEFAALVSGNLIFNAGVAGNGRAINLSVPTTFTATTAPVTFPQASIAVTSTTSPAFASAGSATIVDSNGVSTEFTYTSTDATHFLGCTSISTATFASGSTVVLATKNVTISGNTIAQCQQGIFVGDPSLNDTSRILDVVITGNNIRTTPQAIVVGALTGFIIQGNNIHSYKVGQAGAPRGIQVGYARNGSVAGNVIFNDDGGDLTIIQTGTQTHVTLANNVTRDTPTQAWFSQPAFTTPAFPGTGVRVVNQTGMTQTVYLTAGTNAITQVWRNGTQGNGQFVLPGVTAGAGGGISPPIRLPAGGDIQLTYVAGGAPAWLWVPE